MLVLICYQAHNLTKKLSSYKVLIKSETRWFHEIIENLFRNLFKNNWWQNIYATWLNPNWEVYLWPDCRYLHDNEFQPYLKAWERYHDDIHYLEWRIKSTGLFFCQFNYKRWKLSLPLKERSMQSYHFWIYCLQDCLTDWSQRFFAKKHILKGMMPIGDPMYKKTANLLIHQVHLFCNLKEDLLSELELLRDVFISNGKLS